MLPQAKSFQPFVEVAQWRKLLKLCKFVFLAAFVLGGWALAAASLHVVRHPRGVCSGIAFRSMCNWCPKTI